MPKVKFNVKGVERWGTGEPVPKGVYKCKVESCTVNKPPNKDRRIEVVYVIDEGDYKGRKLFDYINLESEAAAGKVRQFLETFRIVTGKKESGEFDPEELVDEECNVRVIHQPGQAGTQYEGTVSAKVGGTLPLDDTEEEDEDLDGEEGESEEDEENGEIDLDNLDRAELKKLIKDEELDITVKRAWSDDELRAAIAETMSENGDGEEEDEEEQDYNEMDLDELKATLKERGLKTTGSKKIMVARLEKDDEESGSDGDPF